MKPSVLTLFLMGFLLVGRGALAADQSAPTDPVPFSSMSLEELKAVNSKALSKADLKAYKAARKAAEKAERARLAAEKKRQKEKAEAQRYYEKQERKRLARVAKSYDDTRITRSDDGSEAVANGMYVVQSTSAPSIYSRFQSTFGPQGERHFVQVVVSYFDYGGGSDDSELGQGSHNWIDFNRGIFHGGDPLNIVDISKTATGCSLVGCQLTETLLIDLPRPRLVASLRASFGLDFRLMSTSGREKLINMPIDTISGYLRVLNDRVGAFGEEVEQYPELREQLPY